MSRTQHLRPSRATGDDFARVTQAAIGVADSYNRFMREFERFHRTLGETQMSTDDRARAITLAGRGRADRTKALNEVFTSLKRITEPATSPDAETDDSMHRCVKCNSKDRGQRDWGLDHARRCDGEVRRPEGWKS